MLRSIITATAFSAFALSPAALAQKVVGSAFIDGQKVELFEDFSWTYANDAAANCESISKLSSFCGNPKVWKSFDPGSSEIAGAYRFDDRHYAMIIDEGLGANDGVSPQAMQKIVVQNAAAGAGVPVSAVTVSDIKETSFGEGNALNTIYSVKMEGIDLTYSNTIVVGDSTSHQLITYGIGTTMTDKHLRIHEDFLENIRLK